MISFEIKTFKEKHLEDAAKLFAGKYRLERKSMTILPPRYEDFNTILPLLRDLIQKVPGVVSIEDGKLSGYLIGRSLPSWRGKRSVFVPFWGHSVTGEHRKKHLEQMYAHLSMKWIANGCFTHLISVLVHEKEIIDRLFWFGFGMAAVDTMRDLSDINGPVADMEIRRASIDDVDIVVSLDHELARYLAGPPVYMAMTEKRNREYHEKWLSKSSHPLWLALYKDKAVSYMKMCPLIENYVITDDKTAWIQGAYTDEHIRGKGIGTALLQQCLNWARTQGYQRCAVDFEGENTLACAFWLRHFQPICFSLVRQIDKRIGWAHKNRLDENIW